MTREVESTLGKLANAINIPRKKLISEDVDDLDMDADYGLILAYGYPVSEKINVNAGYYLGLADHGDSESGAMKFNGLFLFLGYNF